jgi:hypothetical protein
MSISFPRVLELVVVALLVVVTIVGVVLVWLWFSGLEKVASSADADGFPWVVEPGRLEYLDVWMPVGPPSDVGGGVVAGCKEAVVSGAVYVVMTSSSTCCSVEYLLRTPLSSRPLY